MVRKGRKSVKKKAAKNRSGGMTVCRKTMMKKVAVKKPVSKQTAKKRSQGQKAFAAPLAPSGVPNIDYSLCQGCGGCAEAFPFLFEMHGERAWVINPETFDPVRDAGVMTICPYYAIAIEKV
jgi:ferredoxin